MVEKELEHRPFVTIGVTTFNRHDLLRQTLDSILAQTFADFEVIVGNDYTEEVLTGDMIGISDTRIHFINHPQNLREVGNMNALVEMASGRYFTWLFDDDLYHPQFLQTAYDCLNEAGLPPAFFTTFRFLRPKESFNPEEIARKPVTEFTGREFLRWYSPRRMQVASVLGIFDREKLRQTVGPLEELCSCAIGVYSEYLFLVRCALFNRIIYVDMPLILYRVHSDSWSMSPFELTNYVDAGKQLVHRCSEVLRHPKLVEDYDANLMMICEQHLITIAYRSAKFELVNSSIILFSLFHAMGRYRKEALNIRSNFLSQGGSDRFSARLNFIKIDLNCYRIVLRASITHFLKRFVPVKGIN